MENTVSGEIRNHNDWFLNEVKEFEVEYFKNPKSKNCLLEAYDVLSFFVIQTMNHDKTYCFEQLISKSILSKLIEVLEEDKSSKRKILLDESFREWLSKKEFKYGVASWRKDVEILLTTNLSTFIHLNLVQTGLLSESRFDCTF